MGIEKYKVGEVVELTYIGHKIDDKVKVEIKKIEEQGIWLPLGCKGHVSYYLFNDFKERLKIEDNQLVVER